MLMFLTGQMNAVKRAATLGGLLKAYLSGAGACEAVP
jgi:hypothetical protein